MTIEPKLKPLYANLKRLNIGEYLSSKEFDLFTIEKNLDEDWKACIKYVLGKKRVLDMTSISYDIQEEAFIYLFSDLFFWDNYRNLLLKILLNFSKWSKIKLDYIGVIDNLKNLDISKEDVLLFIKDFRKVQETKPDELKDIKIEANKEILIENDKSTTKTKSANVEENLKVFISHSSKDKEMVKNFIDHILILGLGLKRESIFCTSILGIDIKSGDDFKKSIKDELLNAKVVLQIITKNYKRSEICLNEMGAAWIISKNVIPLVADPFNYDVGFIHSSSQQLMLNSKDDLLKLYDDYKTIIFDDKVNIGNFHTQIDKFIKYINDYIFKQDLKTESIFFYDEEATIQGTLYEGIFSHPPSSIETPPHELSYHRYYHIELNPPIDILSNEILREKKYGNYSRLNISSIHVVKDSKASDVNLREMVNKKVVIKGKFMGGQTAWHRREVLIFFTEIKIIE